MRDSTERYEEVGIQVEVRSGGGNDSAVDKGLVSDRQVVTGLEPILCLGEWR